MFSKQNLSWVVFVLAAMLIGTLSVRWATVQGLPDIISLALSFSSLILAIIAIVQTLSSGDSLARSLADVGRAAEAAREASEKVETAGSRILSHVQGLSDLPTAIGEMSEKLKSIELGNQSQEASSPSSKATEKIEDVFDVETFFSRSTNGTVVAIYMAGEGYKHGIPVSGKQVFGLEQGEYYTGSIAGLRASGLIGATIIDHDFVVSDMGPFSDELVSNMVKQKMDDEFVKGRIEKIDTYISEKLAAE